MKTNFSILHIVSSLLPVCYSACSDSNKDGSAAADGAASGSTARDAGSESNPGSAELPPMGHDDVEAWLAAGQYKAWTCESALHGQRAPSPHGKNRICSNDLLSKAGAGEYPVGAAAVKELYADDGTLAGYAVSRHLSAGSSGGAWYWYERVPLTSPAPHDSRGVVADGLGASGPAMSICVGCHAGAGTDAAHFGHDFVYTQIRPGGDSSQTPPAGHDALEGWLASGEYKRWHCEPALHDARSPSPHGQNRICSNELLSMAGAGEYPVGAAAVKELYGNGSKLVGYAVSRHASAGPSGGTWYWYERVPLDSSAPHDGAGVVADGAGDSGAARSICVGCHSGAGMDSSHSGHDMVYTQVK